MSCETSWIKSRAQEGKESILKAREIDEREERYLLGNKADTVVSDLDILKEELLVHNLDHLCSK